MRRHTINIAAATMYRFFLTSGSYMFWPNTVVKVLRPLKPPVCLMVATSSVANATASAWVRIAK